MAATAQAQPEWRTVRDVVQFAPNQPVEVALRFPAGKIIQGMNGDRVMFSLVDDRVMFLDLGPAQRINELKVKPGEKFVVCLKWSGKRGEAKEWTAWLSPDTELRRAQGEARAAGDPATERKLKGTRQRREAAMQVGQQANGTFMVPGLGRSVATAPAPKPAKDAECSIHQGWAQFLLSETNTLVDVCAAARKRAAAEHGQTVSPEDVRTLMVMAFQLRHRGPNVA